LKGRKIPNGTFVPNDVYANVGRRHAGKNFYHELELLADIAGRLPATLPFEGDFLGQKQTLFGKIFEETCRHTCGKCL